MKRTQNIKISTRLALSFGILVIICIFIGITGNIGMDRISSEGQSLYEQQTKPLEYISNMIQAVQSMYIEANDAVINVENKPRLEVISLNISNDEKQFTDNQKAFMSKFKDSSLANEVGKLYEQQYLPAINKVINSAVQGNINQTQTALQAANDSYSNLINKCNQCFKNNNKDALNKSESNVTLFHSLAMIMDVILVLGLIFAIFSYISVKKSISKPINELVKTAELFSEDGKLDQAILYHSNNELGTLAQCFRSVFKTLQDVINEISLTLAKIAEDDISMSQIHDYKGDFSAISKSLNTIINKLNSTIGSFQVTSDQVSSSAIQVSNGAQALAQGASEQTSSIEELSTIITDLSTKVMKNDKNAANANHKVTNVKENVEKCNEQMQQMILAMTKINGSSNEISKIIKTIEDIAFQTNILALNAAVEAARAGQAGKGFAVVADEVRNLASKSAQAAKNTTVLIQNSMSEVENGTIIANSTANQLFQVVEDVKEVAGVVKTIADASNQQANSISQVITGIEQISAVVQTNSATSEESAAASEELSSQAEMLNKQLSKFTLRGAH